MRTNPATQNQPTPGGFQTYFDLYGEQVTADPLADIDKFFTSLAVQGVTVVGAPTGLNPLAILTSNVRPSNTAISVIGEALVGWFLERQGFLSLARPIGEGPDFIFADPQVPKARLVLVEVKSTKDRTVKTQMIDVSIQRLQYAKNVADPGYDLARHLTGVIIKGSSDFDLLSLKIELT